MQAELGGELLNFHLRSRLSLKAVDSEVLLRDTDGRIVLTRKQVGKGTVYFFALPAEKECISYSGNVDKNYFELYSIVAKDICEARPLRAADRFVTVTIHPVSDGKVIAAMVNNSSRAIQNPVEVNPAWQVNGELPAVIPPREMLFVELQSK